VSAIAWNAVRDQLGMGVRDQWNAQGMGMRVIGAHSLHRDGRRSRDLRIGP
jgi:hypothetical protein